MPNLIDLRFAANNLTSLPESLGYLRLLRKLDCSNNRLLALPDSVSMLKTLEVLDVRRNALDSLPVGLGQLRELNSIDVSENPLKELPLTFVAPSSDFVLAWLRREYRFFRVAMQEWDAHGDLYLDGTYGLEHFIEMVARSLPKALANILCPPGKKAKKANALGTSNNADENDDTSKMSSYSSASSSSSSSSERGHRMTDSISSSSSCSVATTKSQGSSSSSSSALSQGTSVSMIQYRIKKRAEAQAAAVIAANAQLRERISVIDGQAEHGIKHGGMSEDEYESCQTSIELMQQVLTVRQQHEQM